MFRCHSHFLIALSLGIAMLTGCSQGASYSEAQTTSVGGVVVATVAWKAEFERAREETNLQGVKEILSDDTITESELSQLQDEFRECLVPFGVDQISFSPTGNGYEARSLNSQKTATDEDFSLCEARTGYSEVAYLYYGVRNNPENVDPNIQLVQCFKDKGYVPQTYTVEDWQRDNVSGVLPMSSEQFVEALSVCES